MTPQPPPGQTQGPLDQMPPLANPFVQGQPPPPQSLPQSPQGQYPQQVDPEVYTIDPLVLERPVKIRVDGASRMVTKDILAQTVQFLLPIIGNGPFVQQLAATGQTIDWDMWWKLIQDATGVSKQYPLTRPMTPQEEQRTQQPSPDAKMAFQGKQLDMQTRTQLGQQKSQTEQLKLQVQQDLEEKRISEESARHILDYLQAHNDANSEAKRQEAQVKLQSMQQEHAMKLQHLQQKGQIEGQVAMHKGQIDQHLGQQKLQMQSQQNQMDMQTAHTQHQGSMMQAKALLAKGHAQAQTARMQPKKPAQAGSNGQASTKPSPKPAR